MTLSTHAVIGAVIAKAIPGFHPIIQFFFAFISHFLLDAIPHGHYPISSARTDPKNPFYVDMPLNKKSLPDFFKIGLDLLIGLGLAFFVLGRLNGSSYLTLGIGAIGGILPDALQFLYWKIHAKPLAALQKFHLEVMHTKNLLDTNQPLTFLIETVTIVISILIASIFIGY